ncbi:putative 3-octaprenyl-4-hydroxybenzoate carboxy-lyase [Emericellopsis atlantica]|uniref:Ferulic acid decarboxylase 1 n=1 Tax=Emericellopsis atlantica TaxID=2614577 RepID=A0A9P8CMR1_9HYPO|nr:putative 3-octaprenyl-4-hydroxybenzoate carboxy-lyase [Emericellopsis atlantica]KAG9252974.1 putative 3-octaprenyl-4-hydroxybenzoate carboxy-lyase [Emericellopsis atlantica]
MLLSKSSRLARHLPTSQLHRHLRHQSSLVTKQEAIDAQLNFRTFIDVLQKDGDLAEITREVDPHLEVGAIVRRVSETNAKAPLFQNVKGAKDGLFRIFGNAASLRRSEKERYGRIARNIGLEPEASWKDVLVRTQEAKTREPMKPNIVADGPCKQNKIFGEDIDLHKLPAPMLHADDGGKYLQTYGVHLLRSPDGTWTNCSIFRGMIHDSRSLVCLVGTGQHNAIIREKWIQAGKTEMPWALALGVPPSLNLAAALPIPEGVTEVEYIGAQVGKPLDMVKCELSGLEVPATSEIVLEGTASLVDKAYEGPFEDFLGLHFDNDKHMHPLFKVDAITYRDDAILPVSVPGRITDESHTTCAMASEKLLSFVKDKGFPILDANAPLEMMGTWCALKVDTAALTASKTTSKEFCEALGQTVFRNKSSMLTNRILLFGPDVDIYSLRDILWALATRCRPGQDEFVFEDVPSFPLTPYMCHGGGSVRNGGKVIMDCLFPMEYRGEKTFHSVDFETSYPRDIQERVLQNWESDGLGV